MSDKRAVAPTLRPEDVVRALKDACGYDKPDAEMQAKAVRRFRGRIADFLAHLPADAKAGDIARMLKEGTPDVR